MKPFKPMLAVGRPKEMTQDQFIKHLQTLPRPWGVTPKIDGIRCSTIRPTLPMFDLSDPVCRSMKPVPNRHIRELMRTQCIPGLDGELTCGNTFQAVTSGIMSHQGQPTFKYHVFDYFGALDDNPRMTYKQRVEFLHTITLPKFASILEPVWLMDIEDVLAQEEHYLRQGAEGLMLRPDCSPYKYGRSTLREGWLVKLKRFEDSEATIIGWDARDHNTNEAERNELGYQERSSAKAGMQKVDELGAFEVEDIHSGVKFWVGSGFTAQERIDFWRDREKLKGEILKYKFQPFGVKEKPRTPIYLGWRDVIDMDDMLEEEALEREIQDKLL